MQHSRKAIIEMILFGIFAALILIAFKYVTYRDQIRLDALKASAVAADARIVAKQCQNHGQVRYSFLAGGKEYTRLTACDLDCDASNVGDAIKINYAKNDPDNSTCLPISDMQCNIDGASGGDWLVALAIFAFGIGRAVLADESRQARRAG